MRRHVVAEAGQPHGAGETGLDRADRRAVPLYYRIADDAFGGPAPQVSEQARRKRDGRLPLLGLTLTVF
jgi:hypothetical protein